MGHLVAVFDQIFKAAKLGARLNPYEIMATSPTAGVIEVKPLTVVERRSSSRSSNSDSTRACSYSKSVMT